MATAALRRVKKQDKAGVSPGRAPVPEGARVRVQKLEVSPDGCRKGATIAAGSRCRCTNRLRSPRGPGRGIRSGSLSKSGCPPPGTVGNEGFRRCATVVLPRRQSARGPSKKGRVRPEDFMCQTVEELIQWIDARQSDIQHAVATGKCNRSQQVGRFDGRRNRAAEKLDIESINVESHGGVNFEHLQVQSPHQVPAKYGLRGIRVGEAAHLGPPSSSWCRRARRNVHPWEISSD